MKGCINKQFTVWCGRCPRWLQFSENTKASFTKAVHLYGWKDTKAFGWLCPECVPEVARGDEEVGYRHVE